MKIKLIVLAAIMGILSIGGCIFTDEQEKLLFFPEKLAADYKFDFKNLKQEFFVDVDGAQLNVLRFYPSQIRGSVLYFHGNAGSLKDWGAIGSELSDLGLEVFIVDYRGFGKSSGEISSQDQLLADTEAVFMACQKMTNNPLIVYGRSLGTSLANNIASKIPVKGVILESAFSSMTAMAQFHFPLIPSSLLRYPLESLGWAKKYSGPIYAFHGDKDEVVPYEEATKFKSDLGSRFVLTTVPGGNHNDLILFAEFVKARNAYFDTILAN